MTGEVLLAIRLLVGASLFTFLGFLLWFLWNDLRIQSNLLASRQVPPISLQLEMDDGEVHLNKYTLAEITIGRDPACECALTDEAISSHHARLTYHRSQWWLEDLGSKNGTMLNQVLLTMPTVVTSGDIIRCGHTNISVIVNPHKQDVQFELPTNGRRS